MNVSVLVVAFALLGAFQAPALAAAARPQADSAPEQVRVDRDDVKIERSCVLDPSGLPIDDDEGDGVVHIVGDGITVEFTRTPFLGAAPDVAPNELKGVAIRVTGKNVVLRGALVSGFKVGVWATGADGLRIEGCQFSDNFRQRLGSTPAAEDLADWLWPHQNDHNEWLTNYGAAIYVEEARDVQIRANVARSGQNGICLRRVEDSAIYDNDMGWLSGWGLALYRSSRNVVDHNSFDFCVRGYSHGVYSRGQDSAGILVFEQCCDNVFAYNSATHSGDGFFGFAGSEALEGDGVDHRGLGCNRNLVYGNDFSYSTAIGIELTFSFDNVFEANRLVGGNYGVWGGYSQRTLVLGNDIADNAISGVAVEHGRGWRIADNRFARNKRAIELWWDEDKDLLAKPWAKANGAASQDTEIRSNRFDADELVLELRGGASAAFDGEVDAANNLDARIKVDEASKLSRGLAATAPTSNSAERLAGVKGVRAAVGARPELEGRDKILVTEWGPYDRRSPLLWRVEQNGASDVYQLYGEEAPMLVDAGKDVRVKLDGSAVPPRYTLTARKPGVTPYRFVVRLPGRELAKDGVLVSNTWKVGVAPYTTDPREDAQSWRSEVEAAAVWFEAPRLSLAFANDGPSELAGASVGVRAAKLPKDRFGTLASTELELPAGRWKLSTRSDDGVRVRVDGKLEIDNWTHHGPAVDAAELELEAPRTVKIEVEHFELDGYALLELQLTPLAP